MSSSNNRSQDPIAKFSELNHLLNLCINDLTQIVDDSNMVEEIRFNSDNINTNIDTILNENHKCEETLTKFKNGLDTDLANFQQLEKDLREVSKKKDNLEEKLKNLHILDLAYNEVKKEILDKDFQSFSDEKFGFDNAEKEIKKETNNLYKEYQQVLVSKLTMNRFNYMKSSTDAVLESVKNLADTLQSSYALLKVHADVYNQHP